MKTVVFIFYRTLMNLNQVVISDSTLFRNIFPQTNSNNDFRFYNFFRKLFPQSISDFTIFDNKLNTQNK